MKFEGGLGGRPATEFTFLPIDPLCAQGQQEALNPSTLFTFLLSFMSTSRSPLSTSYADRNANPDRQTRHHHQPNLRPTDQRVQRQRRRQNPLQERPGADPSSGYARQIHRRYMEHHARLPGHRDEPGRRTRRASCKNEGGEELVQVQSQISVAEDLLDSHKVGVCWCRSFFIEPPPERIFVHIYLFFISIQRERVPVTRDGLSKSKKERRKRWKSSRSTARQGEALQFHPSRYVEQHEKMKPSESEPGRHCSTTSSKSRVPREIP